MTVMMSGVENAGDSAPTTGVDGCRFSPVYDELDTGVFADAKAALDWAETERANLLAAQQVAAGQGWTELVYQFGEVLWNPLRPVERATEVGDPWLQSGALSTRTAHTARPTTRTPSCRTLNGPWASRRR